MSEQAQHVLSGYKVLDFSQYIAGPTATRMMAEMGAKEEIRRKYEGYMDYYDLA